MPIEYDDELVNELREKLSAMVNPVKLVFLVDPGARCDYCDEIRSILKLLTSSSDKLEFVELSKGSLESEKFEAPLYPAILMNGGKGYNIRFFGAPVGYEFATLVEDIIDVSQGYPRGLPIQLAEALIRHVTRRTVIKVFVTPTCPYCPLAVRTAHRFAMVNPLIYGDMIESLEFPELADAYGVYAVPKVVIEVDGEDKAEFEGALPEVYFAAEVLKANGVDPRAVGLAVTRRR